MEKDGKRWKQNGRPCAHRSPFYEGRLHLLTQSTVSTASLPRDGCLLWNSNRTLVNYYSCLHLYHLSISLSFPQKLHRRRPWAVAKNCGELIWSTSLPRKLLFQRRGQPAEMLWSLGLRCEERSVLLCLKMWHPTHTSHWLALKHSAARERFSWNGAAAVSFWGTATWCWLPAEGWLHALWTSRAESSALFGFATDSPKLVTTWQCKLWNQDEATMVIESFLLIVLKCLNVNSVTHCGDIWCKWRALRALRPLKLQNQRLCVASIPNVPSPCIERWKSPRLSPAAHGAHQQDTNDASGASIEKDRIDPPE